MQTKIPTVNRLVKLATDIQKNFNSLCDSYDKLHELFKENEGNDFQYELTQQLLNEDAYPFNDGQDFESLQADINKWANLVQSKAEKMVNLIELIDCTGERHFFDSEILPELKKLIAKNITADQIQDLHGIHRIIVFTSNPVLFQ